LKRRVFLATAVALATASGWPALADEPPADGPPAEGSPVDGPFGKWTVEEISGKPVSPKGKVTMEIGTDGMVFGSGGCNRYRGSAKVADGGSLSFGPAASTQMMCEPEISEQEMRFLRSIEEVRSWRKDGTGLVLLDQAGGTVLRLAAAS
jgi:heat shock protein HslJ